MRKILYKIITILVFLLLTLSPIWSVWLVMQCEAFKVRYNGLSWTNHIHVDHRVKSYYKRAGLGVKYDKLQ